MEKTSNNIAVVRRLYEARGNPDIVAAVLAPDVCWEVVEGFPYGGTYRGASDVIGRFFARLFQDFEDWRTEPQQMLEAHEYVFALGSYAARAKATGRPFTARFAHLWTVRGGIIVQLRQCADTVQIARVLERDFDRRH
jgi:ketosteroid isomerase-like protein